MQDFSWERLGDIALGRENLGELMPVAVYRLMQYTLVDALTEACGAEKADEVFRSAGFIAGRAFAKNLLNLEKDFDHFVADLQKLMKEMKIGVLRMEKSDLEKLTMTLTVSEDLDCSGLPVTGENVCVYDEGFIGGILNAYTGKLFIVKEIDCWAAGDRTCRFEANVTQ